MSGQPAIIQNLYAKKSLFKYFLINYKKKCFQVFLYLYDSVKSMFKHKIKEKNAKLKSKSKLISITYTQLNTLMALNYKELYKKTSK